MPSCSAASFLNPNSVVVIGVSRHKGKIGRLIFDHQLERRLNLFGVNSQHSFTVAGKKIVRDIASLPVIPDLAVYAIPAERVVNELEKAAEFGIKNHLIISSGFKEIGKDGEKRQEAIVKIAAAYRLCIQGPNCLGNISPSFKTNISFGKTPLKGNIGLILQSGAVGTAFLDWACEERIGISHFVSLGNKAVLTESEFLEFFGNDRSTEVIGLYLESLSHPLPFITLASKITVKKPIVVLLAGKTKASSIAISSHTGALAGSFTATTAAFRQAGVIEADDLQQFFLILRLLASKREPLLKKTMVVTNAGGPGVLLVDNLTSRGFSLYQPNKKSLRNPQDLLGDADAALLGKFLDLLPKRMSGLVLFIILTPQEKTDLMAMSKTIISFAKKFTGMLIVNLIGGDSVVQPATLLKKKGVITETFSDSLVAALDKIKQKPRVANNSTEHSPVKSAGTFNFPDHGFLPEKDCLSIARHFGLPVVKSYFLKNSKEAVSTAHLIKYPVVLKLSSPEVIHRNKEGAVFLDIKSDAELLQDYSLLTLKTGQIVLQKSIEADAEVILGAKKDPQFNYLVAFGSGGIHTEYLKDINFAVTPLFSYQTMLNLIKGTKISSLLQDFAKWWKLFRSFINLLHTLPQIDEIDLNPVIVRKGDLFCVDIKIKV